MLLMHVTAAAGDGDISREEDREIKELVGATKAAIQNLSKKFDAARRKFVKPVSKELFSESFFVFAISSFARMVCDYAVMLCDNPPKGTSFGEAMTNGMKQTFTFPSIHHDRFTIRYCLALTFCFIFSVTMDNYGGACAITAVFLLNTRIGPDMMATLNTLLAVVVGNVVGAIIYSYSCMTGYPLVILPLVTCIYWLVTIHIAYSGSSYALIGLFMAALAPFTIVKECPKVVDEAAGALGTWVFIRGCIIAMLIMSIFEFVSVPAEQAKLATQKLDEAIKACQAAFAALWADKDPKPIIVPVAGELGSAGTFSTGAKLEPRFWRCKWKAELMDELIAIITKVRVDVLTICHAMGGSDGHPDGISAVLSKVPAVKQFQKDLDGTLEDAREISEHLLSHGYGRFTGLSKLDTVDGLDELDGYDAAIDAINKLPEVKFPNPAPETMEDDLLCQLSITFMMLDYTIKHIADIIKATIRKS